ncbi:distal tail protein Dit [Paludifilum halophilum]|uniref:Phage tail protein n=1 Tax=Paludifilum halophilum TaxID=1642702 RepID=A0A235B8C0_9BACL|nr:distal tail protein Dit [Paludifilum halophilum]OYD08550.1 hypothetical protein CHM34_06910 [Paludifilum halophilum]
MLTFDNQHATNYVDKVLDVVRPAAAPRSARLQEVEGRAGAYYFGTDTEVYEIEARLFIKGENRSDLWQKVRAANAWLLKEDLRKLVLDDEPDKHYMAVCNDAIDLEEILEYGFATVTFIVPDAYAVGETKDERITAPALVFERNSVRYKDNGSEITSNYPYYKSGKYAEGIFVEEGTENLLYSAAAPESEELFLPISSAYFLSLIDGSASIEHKFSNAPAQSLDKEGANYNGLVDTGWDGGTHSGTTGVSNDFLELARSGTDLYISRSTTEDWDMGTHVNTEAVNHTLTLSSDYMPGWEIVDEMDDYAATGWTEFSGSGPVSQEDGFVRIFTPEGETQTSNTGIYKDHGSAQTSYTFTFKYKLTGGPGRVWVSNSTDAVRAILPETGGGWKWAYLDIQDITSSADLYVDGELVNEGVSTGFSSSSTRFQIYIDEPDTGNADITLDFDAFRADLGYSKGAPPSNGEWTGTWTSGYDSLSSVGNSLNDLVDSAFSVTAPDGSDQNIVIETQLRADGVEQGWNEVAGGSGSIPGIKDGDNLSNVEINLRFALTTKDPAHSPEVYYADIDITSGYLTSGYRDSPVVTSLQQVVKAARTAVSWVNNAVPTGTSVRVYTRYSPDGGMTWATWAEVANNGDPVTGISQDTDLSDAQFQYKVELSTEDVSVTPSVDSLSYDFYTGYKPSQTFSFPAQDVNSIGVSAGSVIDWTANTTDTGTSVTVETSLDGSTWTTATDGGSLVSSGTDLTGKSIYVRYTLSTNDTNNTPTMDYIEWRIAQNEPNHIVPATGAVVITPTNVARWQLESKPYPTSWHDTGTREDETAKVWVKQFATTSGNGGTAALWFEKKPSVDSSRRFLWEFSGSLKPLALFREDDVYVLEYQDERVIEWDGSGLADGFHHAAVRWSEESLDLFIDGELVGNHPMSMEMDLTGAEHLYVGCSSAGNGQLNAVIDDIMLSKRTFTDEEVEDLASSDTEAEVDKDTAALYHLDESLSASQTSNVVVSGTAPTFPVFTFTFSNSQDHARVSNGADFVLVNRDFEPGDVLVIDCEAGVVTLNGSRDAAMPYLDFDSDFFAITSESEIITDPADDAAVDIKYTERWL